MVYHHGVAAGGLPSYKPLFFFLFFKKEIIKIYFLILILNFENKKK